MKSPKGTVNSSMTEGTVSEEESKQKVTIRAYAELNDFLPKALRGRDFSYPMSGGDHLKHLVESAGIPHTEIEIILLNGMSVGFGEKVESGDRIALYPVFESVDVTDLVKLRREPLRKTAFVLDVHLGRLSAILRLLGFDAKFPGDVDDSELAEISSKEGRILLTRDRMLLKRTIVTHGCFIRSQNPEEQASEVVRRLDLGDAIRPFTRCPVCSGLLDPVEKSAVIHRLEPLTRKHYNEFRMCRDCGKLYWKGSHYGDLVEMVDRIRRKSIFRST